MTFLDITEDRYYWILVFLVGVLPGILQARYSRYNTIHLRATMAHSSTQIHNVFSWGDEIMARVRLDRIMDRYPLTFYVHRYYYSYNDHHVEMVCWQNDRIECSYYLDNSFYHEKKLHFNDINELLTYLPPIIPVVEIIYGDGILVKEYHNVTNKAWG